MSESGPLLDRPSWAPSWVPTVDDVRAMRWFRWIVGLVLAVGLAACVVESADSPADPELGGDDPVVTGTSEPGDEDEDDEVDGSDADDLAARFGTIVVDLVTASGEVLELCLLDADEPAERGRGLMEVTDLEGHDGMLFRFDQDVQSNFVMVDTVTPLTISWWSAEGTFVSTADMAPCTEPESSDCARYAAEGPYRYAVEVFQGERPEAAEGATIEVRSRSCTV